MAGNTDSDSSNYGDEVDYDEEDHDYSDNQDQDGYQGDDHHEGEEEEDEEFGEFGEVGEASVIQSELGSGSDRDIMSPRTPGGPPGSAGFIHGMVHGGLAGVGGNLNFGGNNGDLDRIPQHSRMSSLDSIPMSEGIVGQIPPSEYGSQFDAESSYGNGNGDRGYGWTHSRQLSGVSTTFDDRISYVPSSQWGNVEESAEEGYEGQDEHQQQQHQYQYQEGHRQEEEEEEEEILVRRGPGGRPLSGYFPGAGRYDGEYDDDREFGDGDEEDDEGDGYADELEGEDHHDDGSEEGSEVDENEELTEIIEQLRPYMMLSGASPAGNPGRISA